MAPLDEAVQQDALTLLEDQQRGERLSIESDEEKWPLGRRIRFLLVSSLVLWIGIYFAIRSVF